MSDTTFPAGIVISSTWLNVVNDTVYGAPVSTKISGTVSDGATDNSAAIIAASAAGNKVISIPPNTKFNRKTVIAGMSPSSVVWDFSSINDFQSAGETTKHVGIMSSDTEPNDTHFSIDSGHHCILAFNNFGTSGTTSGAERKASIIWNNGQFALGASNSLGFRGVAIQQFTQDTGNNFWVWSLRSLAPYSAGANEYENWAAGQVISGAGIYRYYETITIFLREQELLVRLPLPIIWVLFLMVLLVGIG